MSVRYISVVIDWKILHHFATIFQSRLSSHETRKIIPFNLHNSNAFTRTRAHPLRPSPSPIHNQDMRSSTFFTWKESPQMSRTISTRISGRPKFAVVRRRTMKYHLRLFMEDYRRIFPVSILYWKFFNDIYDVAMKRVILFNDSIYELKKYLIRIYWEDTLYSWNLEFIIICNIYIFVH